MLGDKRISVFGNMCIPEPHRHHAGNAKKRRKDVRRVREGAAFEALRRTLTITPAELRKWVAERVARLDLEAARDAPPTDTREEELAKLW